MPEASQGAIRGSYRLVRRLGAGGSGEVWVGRHVETGGIGAVKLLRGRRGREGLRRMFAREAAAIARLSHPHIVSLFELGAEHIVTAFVDGSDLSRRMRGGIDAALAQRIAVQIGAALAYAHARGVVHRDVKPGNILIDRNDNAFLSDFGLATLADEPGEHALRGGTPGFMAPEQARGEPAQPAADQFSLARTILEILAGGTDHADVETALALAPPVAAPLLPALRRATGHDPGARFASMAEFVAAIERVTLPDVAPVVRLAPERRGTGSFEWAGAPSGHTQVAPAIARADFSLASLEAGGQLSRAAGTRFREATGYADFGWSLYARSDRLGPLSPSLPARAGELIVLCHGWMGTRAVWHDLAIALCRDNADALVLAPDALGFGDSNFSATATLEQLGPAALPRAVVAWLELLGLRDLPGVVVGHSAAGVSVLADEARLFGDKLVRIALTPSLLRLSPGLVLQWRINNFLVGLSQRLRWLRPILAWLVRQPNRMTEGLGPSQRAAIAAQFSSVAPRQLVDQSKMLLRLRLPADALRGVELIYGARDPVFPRAAALRAVAELGGTLDRTHLMASGGHNPHILAEEDPEGSQRNLAELTQIIGSVLLSAVDGAASSTLALSRTM